MSVMSRRVWSLMCSPAGLAGLAGVFVAVAGCGITVQQRGEGPTLAGLDGSGDGVEHVPVTAPETGQTVWPERLAVWSGLRRSTIEKYHARPMGVIQRIDGPLSSARPGEVAAQHLDDELLADGRTLISRMRSGTREPFVTVTSEGKGAVLYYPVPKAEAVDVPVPIQGRATFFLKFISAVRESTPADARVLKISSEQSETPLQPTTLRIQRTWFAYYDPTKFWQDEHKGVPARGVVVLLPGMFGTPRELIDETTRRLRAKGWAVLRMLAQPSRFTERVDFAVNANDIEGSAKQIGRVLQDRGAECAYSVQAAMLQVLQERPDLANSPRVALGMSGGAMVLPTVVAREPAAYAGAITIAGGCDYLRIAIDSNYASWIDALHFTWNVPDPTAAQVDRLVAAYRADAPLDPISTAGTLVGKPVLMVHGETDRAVPARCGEELWQLMGRPERWLINGGHEWVFLSMPYHLNKMIDWMDANIPAPKTPEPPPSAKPAKAAT